MSRRDTEAGKRHWGGRISGIQHLSDVETGKVV